MRKAIELTLGTKEVQVQIVGCMTKNMKFLIIISYFTKIYNNNIFEIVNVILFT